MYRYLNDDEETGVTFKAPNMFAQDERSIYFVADPPHLMKTARNCLAILAQDVAAD